jgi:hypothetical protein
LVIKARCRVRRFIMEVPERRMRKHQAAPAMRSSEFPAKQLASLSASTAADSGAVSAALISQTALSSSRTAHVGTVCRADIVWASRPSGMTTRAGLCPIG